MITQILITHNEKWISKDLFFEIFKIGWKKCSENEKFSNYFWPIMCFENDFWLLFLISFVQWIFVNIKNVNSTRLRVAILYVSEIYDLNKIIVRKFYDL